MFLSKFTNISFSAPLDATSSPLDGIYSPLDGTSSPLDGANPPQGEETKKPQYHPERVIFGGQGLQILSDVGGIASLEEHNLVKDIKEVCGISSGSIIAFCMTLGYTYSEIYNIILIYNSSICSDYELYGNVELIYDLYKTKGLYPGIRFKLWLKNILRNKLDVNDITFLELYKQKKIIINFMLNNVNTSEIEIFNKETYPNVSIIDTIIASSNLGILYPPLRVENNKSSFGYYDYCDAILSKSFDISIWDNIKPDNNVIGFLPINNFEKNIIDTVSKEASSDNIYHYIVALLEIILKSKTNCYYGEQFWERTVPLISSESSLQGIYSLLKDDIDLDKKVEIINLGKESTEKFLVGKHTL